MKILFVCLTDTCRAPLAAEILKEKLKKRNIVGEVDSAGFESFHINDPPEKRVIKIGKKHEIDISAYRARLFKTEDFDNFDKIFVMDSTDYRNIKYFIRNEKDKKKIDYVMNVLKPGKNQAVPDPFYRKLGDCEKVYNLLDKACNKIADSLAK
ncbi:MAG: low molecular weight phosphotyrosine protein phosphatase [Bacteroidales bacterium]|nr:low molecular weight phosphotyrosine protein phosphatase [Bacteroidales bacterium]